MSHETAEHLAQALDRIRTQGFIKETRVPPVIGALINATPHLPLPQIYPPTYRQAYNALWLEIPADNPAIRDSNALAVIGYDLALTGSAQAEAWLTNAITSELDQTGHPTRWPGTHINPEQPCTTPRCNHPYTSHFDMPGAPCAKIGCPCHEYLTETRP